MNSYMFHVSALFVTFRSMQPICNPLFAHMFRYICLKNPFQFAWIPNGSEHRTYHYMECHPVIRRKSMDFFHFSVVSISVFCSVFTWNCFFLLNNDNQQYKYIQHIVYIPTNPIYFLLVLLFHAYINNRRLCVHSNLIMFNNLHWSPFFPSRFQFQYTKFHNAIYEIHSSYHHFQKIQSFV